MSTETNSTSPAALDDDMSEHGTDPGGLPPSGAQPGPALPQPDASERMAGAMVDGGEALVATLRSAVDAVPPAVDRVVSGTERRLARHRQRRRRGPLPNLFEVHPEARDAPRREIGVLAIPVDRILGTAVEGPAQRGRDFTPLPPFRSKNWHARWQRVLSATRRLEVLPPIDALKIADGYWVTDGHNRVAAALVVGQVEIDANVMQVALPGEPLERPSGSLAGALAGRRQVAAAGAGSLSPGSTVGRPAHAPHVGTQPGTRSRDPEPDPDG